MESTALVRLEPLDLIPPETVPKDRRKAEKDRRRVRVDEALDVVLFSAVTIVAGFFTAAYGVISIFALLCLIFKTGPFFATMLMAAVTGGMARGTLYVNGKRLKRLRAYRAVAQTDRLRLEVDAEQSLADTAFRLNGQVTEWNVAAAIARENDVEDRYREGLTKARERLAARIHAFDHRLKRFRLATMPMPKELPPPGSEEWCHDIRIEIADSGMAQDP